MRVSEVYLSVQGEGPNVGFPTIFTRFGGCNLRCALWPCDTQWAIDPAYRHEWKQHTPEELSRRIVEAAGTMQQFNVCFTGGEPFLQPHRELYALHRELMNNPRVNVVEAFSNGTLVYPTWLFNTSLDVVMDWKLPGSGEETVGFDTRLENIKDFVDRKQLALKYTIASRHDYEVAKELWGAWGMRYQTFAGVVWGKLENDELVKWILEDGLPWKLNVQVHNHVWDRSLRGI